MNRRHYKYVIYIFLLIPYIVMAQGGQESIRREVTLYNPFKPSLKKAGKMNFFPEISDTTATSPVFRYNIRPKAYMPPYEIRTISPARLEPDPLPELYKGFLNLGFGNYFSPYGELSISSDRSRNRIAGIYALHESSFGKIKIEDDAKVFGGYMDNTARIFGTKFMKRTALSGIIDFNHKRRYAYGGYPDILSSMSEPGKDSLKIEYFNPEANLRIYSTRMDSSKLKYDINLYYNLLYQTSIYYQHMAGMKAQFGYDLDIFYAGLDLEYETATITNVEDKFRHRIGINPRISKNGGNWNFRLGVSLMADARYYEENTLPEEYKTKLFFHPDLYFGFNVIPSVFNMFVGLDGEYINNNVSEVIYTNPFIVTHNSNGMISPSANLYTILPTDVQLRVNGGFNGYASENTSYNFRLSYSMFENMVFYINDQMHGRTFVPVYDNGELLQAVVDFKARISDEFSMSASAGYYKYELEALEKPWHKPSWDAELTVKYNLRNKILASAGLYGLGKRYAPPGPSPYPEPGEYHIDELSYHVSLNLGIEYRFTKILSFWAKLDNVAMNRYYEWNLYPSQGILFMAGFSYSL